MNEPTTRPPPPELKRLDSTTRSPIYGQFSELLQGLDTVRALREQSHFATRFAAAVDTHTRAELYLWMCNRWLVIRLQCLSATIAVAIGAYVLFFNQGTASSSSHDDSSGGGEQAELTAGIVLLYATQYTQAVRQAVTQYAAVEQEMNYVERCDEYARLPMQEPYEEGYFDDDNDDAGEGSSSGNNDNGDAQHQHQHQHQHHQDDDPSGGGKNDAVGSPGGVGGGGDGGGSVGGGVGGGGGGSLIIDNLTVKYPTAASPALCDLSISLTGGLRVGVVGRTGAGKSTLAAALFRLVDFQKGRITLDGVDICR